jgi:hypothetical protein
MTVIEFWHRAGEFDIVLRRGLAPADKVRVIGKPGSNGVITVECGISQLLLIKGYTLRQPGQYMAHRSDDSETLADRVKTDSVRRTSKYLSIQNPADPRTGR